jgi:DNA-binding SARP family transcriptional activator
MFLTERKNVMQLEQDIPASVLVLVYLLGPLEVYKRDASSAWKLVPEAKWKNSRPARSVLKRLLVQPGRRLSREQLADDVWSESRSEPSGTTVYNTISVIRGVIGKPLVKLSASAYEIAGQTLVWTDIDAAESLLKAAENQGHTSLAALGWLERALIYLERGKLLEGVYGKWCYAFQKRGEDLLRQCRLWLAESYQRQNKLLQAGLQYWAMCQVMPPDEEALQRWISMLCRQGHIQDALKCYRDVKSFIEAQGYSLSQTFEQVTTPLHSQPDQALLAPSQIFSDRRGRNGDSEETNVDYTRRRLTVRGVELTLGLASLPRVSADAFSERLLTALARQRSPDTGTVQYLHQRVEHYWQQRQIARLGSTLVPYVTEDLQRVMVFLEGPCLSDMRTELSLIVGNLAMLLGELLYESNLYSAARKYYKTAAIAAQEANAPLLEAVIYGRRGLTLIYQNHLQAALSCVQHARQLAGTHDQITMWLAAVEAEIQATMGNEGVCLSSLRNAARLYDLPHQEPFYWVHFDTSLLAGYEGVCFLKLSKPAEAYQALAKAIATLDATTNRRKPRLLIDLADSYIQQRDIEAACDSLLQATVLLHSIHSPVTLKRLLALRKQLNPWQEMASIQTLDESLSQLVESRETMTDDTIH